MKEIEKELNKKADKHLINDNECYKHYIDFQISIFNRNNPIIKGEKWLNILK